jgi:hypothetical protein
MDALLAVLGVVLVLVGFAGVVLPLLPGTPLVFAGLWLGAALGDYQHVSGWTVLALGVVATVAWLVDYVAAAVLVKRVGGTGAAATGAGLGALAGVFAGLPGLILGPVIGATAGQWRSQPTDARQAARVGVAAGLGFVAATVAKLLVALLMVLWFGLAWWL